MFVNNGESLLSSLLELYDDPVHFKNLIGIASYVI